MNNPYKTLGVSENASQEEIRAAYLALVKKYHPDKYRDNPLKELANEKLKEINEAYDVLTKKSSASSTNGSYYGAQNGSYSRTRSSYAGENAAEFSKVRILISQNRFTEAAQMLDSIANHNAEWNYLYGQIHLRNGWYDKAREHFSRAYQEEPNNYEYRNAYNSINNAGRAYSGNPGTYREPTSSSGCGACDVCSGLLCADCCCEMAGGDLIRCC